MATMFKYSSAFVFADLELALRDLYGVADAIGKSATL